MTCTIYVECARVLLLLHVLSQMSKISYILHDIHANVLEVFCFIVIQTAFYLYDTSGVVKLIRNEAGS